MNRQMPLMLLTCLGMLATSSLSARDASMAFSPDGKTLASAGDWTINLWDVPSVTKEPQEKQPSLEDDWKVLRRQEWSRQAKSQDATTTETLVFSSSTEEAKDEKTRISGRKVSVRRETYAAKKGNVLQIDYYLVLKQDEKQRLMLLERPKANPLVWVYRIEGGKLIIRAQPKDAKNGPVWTFSAVGK